MRDIKFRAWHPDSKVMIVFCGNSFKDQFIAHHFGLLVNNEHPEGVDLLMQFTGLKDKNGIDIYEGDILEEEGVSYENGNYSRGQVVFIDGEFSIQYKHSDRNLYDRIVMAKREVVVGNIHQNQELIKP